VGVILDSTTRILVEQGMEKLTTNAVADMAGISVGSLYQYFPGTEALIAALRRRHHDDVNQLLNNAIDSSRELGFEKSLRAVVRANVEAHARDPQLHYLLDVKYADVGFEVLADEPRFSFAGSENEPVAKYLREVAGVKRARAKVMAQICSEIIGSLTHAAVIHEDLNLDSDELVDEIVSVILGYFDRSGVSGPY